ncbi:hypothetical protein B0A49_10759 [Cryomyces minteri]|uniref:Uncharacterized protein n=1 Tax=Cryomyces minteri TaxID=331657 RepID=A0A4V5NCY8_9PEZI|nr:hypothetical protein B0A49_10759 [Cryomyces minteri]
MYTRFGGFLPLAATALFASTSYAQMNRTDSPNSVCLSYGIDFVNSGFYFIDSKSNASFTTVSQFEGCNAGTANVLLVDPTGTEYMCTDAPTQPDDVSQLSTCPISKSQMFSGVWSILLLGNNGNGNPFAYERDITLTVAPQTTTTITNTVTYSVTTTPNTTITVPSTVFVTTTFNATTTYVKPSATASQPVTITPKATTVTSTRVVTRTKHAWTKSQRIITSTETASCTVPPKPQRPDPTCHIVPTKIPLPTGLTIYTRRADRVINVADAKRRFQDAKARRNAMLEERDLVGRAADAPVITITAPVAVNYTTSFTAATTTFTSYALTTSAISTTLSPPTIYSGIYTATITGPTPTKTAKTVSYTTTTVTKTLYAEWTYTTTVTPTASITACRRRGGHWDLKKN